MWVIVNTVHGVKRSRTFSIEIQLKIYRGHVSPLNRAKNHLTQVVTDSALLYTLYTRPLPRSAEN